MRFPAFRSVFVVIPAFLAVTSICATARAQAPWNLTTADFRSEAISLRAIGADGLHVAPLAGGDERLVPYDRFLELTRAASASQPAGKLTLHMLGGDRLGGEPVGIKGNNLIWNSPAIGEISLPMKRLVAITQPGKPAPDRRKEDVVTLANGDTLKGIIASIGGGKISVQAEGGPADAPLASVATVSFAATAGSPTADKRFRIRFDDGSSVVAPSIVLSGDQFKVTFGSDAREIPASRVAAIEQVNGPVSWLSTRAPAESVYVPYFGNESLYPAKMDVNYRGEEIRFRDTRYPRGIGVHAYSRLAWELDGTYAAFRTLYAIDGDGPLADVTVRVKLDDKVAYEQEHVRSGTLSPVVLLDLGQAKRLTLEVDFGANGATQDRFNWIEPALLKNKPAPIATQPALTQPSGTQPVLEK